jgi:hypothetical protein
MVWIRDIRVVARTRGEAIDSTLQKGGNQDKLTIIIATAPKVNALRLKMRERLGEYFRNFYGMQSSEAGCFSSTADVEKMLAFVQYEYEKILDMHQVDYNRFGGTKLLCFRYKTVEIRGEKKLDR